MRTKVNYYSKLLNCDTLTRYMPIVSKIILPGPLYTRVFSVIELAMAL